ncbi:hypothetical protein GGTG_06582 [Gaeumannomyces tritici R3-111a-1]|uniref:Uncharacterized protein n=1 Tax=Gaeumannomyces tritici (strain R3-111a-1) TaxID=644352 RepID=J3NZ82_GAET3|nr:hypothetical protein GGTG_06582 [Gaeumannomyces tritici R3-111a-1]EJT76665.1 hypothetical protein GGTG_06582 [Gaeumannomyces tritici R3-111a-1]
METAIKYGEEGLAEDIKYYEIPLKTKLIKMLEDAAAKEDGNWERPRPRKAAEREIIKREVVERVIAETEIAKAETAKTEPAKTGAAIRKQNEKIRGRTATVDWSHEIPAQMKASPPREPRAAGSPPATKPEGPVSQGVATSPHR